jgi:pimeloyl-ACP methyl ester carboxylesterase
MDHDAHQDTYQNEHTVKTLGSAIPTSNLPTRTVSLPLFGGTTASYHAAPWPPNASNPTLIMINGFATTVDIFRPQLTNHSLQASMNMLAIEPLGHGSTRTKRGQFTYWDSAAMILGVLDVLDIPGKVFVTGISQGGWMAVQTALLAPTRIAGVIPIDTSMSSESPHSLELGCWDACSALSPYIDAWATPSAMRIFEPDASFIASQIASGFGKDASQPDKDFWSVTMKKNWSGEEGRKRARMAAICLRDRDSLRARLGDVKCPVLWLHGERDSDYSTALAREEIELFGSEEKSLEVLDDGTHYTTWSRVEKVNEQFLEFVGKGK